MTHEEYQQRITQINLRCEQISKRTSDMALCHATHTDNPTFVALMNEFDNLINRSEELTSEMLKQLVHS